MKLNILSHIHYIEYHRTLFQNENVTLPFLYFKNPLSKQRRIVFIRNNLQSNY